MTMKHQYVPTWSWGNAITIAVFIFTSFATAAGVYTLLRVDLATASEQNVRQDTAIAAVEVRTVEQIREVRRDVESLKKQANDMAVNQAVLMANVELLVRAQGLRPIEDTRVRP